MTPMDEIDTSTMTRVDLIPLIAAAASRLVDQHGVLEVVPGFVGRTRIAKMPGVEILKTDAADPAMHASAQYGIDVWFDGKKVFSAWWNSNVLRDFQLVRFRRGPWIAIVLGGGGVPSRMGTST